MNVLFYIELCLDAIVVQVEILLVVVVGLQCEIFAYVLVHTMCWSVQPWCSLCGVLQSRQ